jgi:hypothetical protein
MIESHAVAAFRRLSQIRGWQRESRGRPTVDGEIKAPTSVALIWLGEREK